MKKNGVMEYWSNGFNFLCSRFQVQSSRCGAGTLNIEHLNAEQWAGCYA